MYQLANISVTKKKQMIIFFFSCLLIEEKKFDKPYCFNCIIIPKTIWYLIKNYSGKKGKNTKYIHIDMFIRAIFIILRK